MTRSRGQRQRQCSCVPAAERGQLPYPFSTLSRPTAADLRHTQSLLLASDRLGWTFAGPCVGVGALAPNRQAAPMPQAPVATKIHQPFNVHRGLASQVAFDEVVAIDHFADLQNLLVRELRHPPLVRNPHFCYDLPSLARANAVNVLEPDQDPLVGRNVN